MNKLTIEEELQIIDRVNNKTPLKLIISEFGIKSKKTIYDVIERNGRDKIIPNKKFTVDENYFENIDTQDKSYWLGFLYADGYVRMKNNKSGELRLKLGLKDKQHIELFKSCIKSSHKIKDIKSYVTVGDKKYESECSTFSIYNTKIVSDLYRHGCVNNKTFKIKLPNLKEDLIRHFIRGYFDGDGCISIPTNIKILGNEEFISSLQKLLCEKLNSSRVYNYKNGKIRSLIISNIKDTICFMNYIYQDSNIFLERKRKIFNSLL